WRSALSASGVALRPRIARAGSLGSACVAAKTITETRNKVRRPSSARRTTNPQIPCRSGIRRQPRGKRTGAVVTDDYRLAEPERPVTIAELVKRKDALVAALQPLHLAAVAVERRMRA